MAQPQENKGRIPNTGEQMEAGNALVQAETALQTAVETLTRAVSNDDRLNGSKRVQEAKAALSAVQKKYGWVFDWQKAQHDAEAAAKESENAAKEAAEKAAAAARDAEAKAAAVAQEAEAKAKADFDAKARDAHAAFEQAQAKLAADAAAVKKHVVKKGESLSLIAKQYYGDLKKWKTIYEANKHVVGKNPDLIQPGMELVIPEDGV